MNSEDDDGVQAVQEGQHVRNQEEEGQEEGSSGVSSELEVTQDTQPQEEEVVRYEVDRLPSNIVRYLCNSAAQYIPNEICGFILKTDRVIDGSAWRVHDMMNVATGTLEFAMSDNELLDVFERLGSHIVGVWHSHPLGTPRPSQTDIEYSPPGMRYWIVTPTAVTEWDMHSGETPTPINIQYRSS